MLKKLNRNSKEVVPDVPADNPVGTMDRFTDGLRRIISAKKARGPSQTKRKRQCA